MKTFAILFLLLCLLLMAVLALPGILLLALIEGLYKTFRR